MYISGLQQPSIEAASCKNVNNADTAAVGATCAQPTEKTGARVTRPGYLSPLEGSRTGIAEENGRPLQTWGCRAPWLPAREKNDEFYDRGGSFFPKHMV